MRIKPDIPITVGFIKDALHIKAERLDFKKSIKAISTDSREVKRGDLFIGLSGENYDGSKFIHDVKKTAALSIGSLNSEADITLSSPNASLLQIANAYKKLLPIKKTVAITGSVGKTTTKNLLSAITAPHVSSHSTYKNLNNEFGVPFTVLKSPRDTEFLIIEAGMNHAGELKAISSCIEPDISVITKIGTAHIGNLGSVEKIADAKCEILSGMKNPMALIPNDERLLYERIKNYKTVASKNENANFSFFEIGENKFLFKFCESSIPLTLPSFKFSNFHIKHCFAFALAAAKELSLTNEQIKYSAENIDFSLFSNTTVVKDLIIINDSYNSSAEAVIGALDALKKEKCKKSALLGDMLELGEFSEGLHYEIGLHAASANIESLYLIGEYAKYIFEGAVAAGFDKNKIFVNENPADAQKSADDILKHSSNEVILFKASRKIKLERIIDILKKARK